MEIDWRIGIGAIFNIIALLAATISFLITRVKRDTLLDFRLGKLENIDLDQAAELKKISETLASMSNQDRRLTRLEDELIMLRKGEGFILPITGHLGKLP